MDATAIYEALAGVLRDTDPPAYRWLRKNKAAVLAVIEEETSSRQADSDVDAEDLPPEDVPASRAPVKPLTDYEVRALSSALKIGGTLEPENLRSFYLRKSDLPKAEQLSHKYGVHLAVEPLDVTEVQYRIAARRTPPNTDGVLRRRIFEQCADAARRYADAWCHATVSAPPSDWTVLAFAEVDSGDAGQSDSRKARLWNITDDNYWTPARIAALDFGRCDICNAYRARTKVFVASHKRDGRLLHVGGSCAAQLDLGAKVKALVQGMSDYLEALRAEYGEEDMYGLDVQRWHGIPTDVALALADAVIDAKGYVSGRQAEERLTASTAYIVEDRYHNGGARVFDAVAEYLRSPRYPLMLERLQRYVDDRIAAAKPGEDMSFIHNLQRAVLFGVSGRGAVGTFCYGVFAARQALAKEATGNAPPVMWAPNETFDLLITRYADLDPVLRAGGFDLQTFAETLGLPDDFLARFSAGKIDMTKAAYTKISKHPMGQWLVRSRNSFSGDFGTTYYLTLARTSDTARIKVKSTSMPNDIVEGAIVRFGTVFVDDPEPWQKKRDGTQIPTGPTVNRVFSSGRGLSVVPADQIVPAPLTESAVATIPAEMIAAVR